MGETDRTKLKQTEDLERNEMEKRYTYFSLYLFFERKYIYNFHT